MPSVHHRSPSCSGSRQSNSESGSSGFEYHKDVKSDGLYAKSPDALAGRDIGGRRCAISVEISWSIPKSLLQTVQACARWIGLIAFVERQLGYRNAFITILISSSGEGATGERKSLIWLRTDHPDRYLIARCGIKKLVWKTAVVSSDSHRSGASVNALNKLLINVLRMDFDQNELLGVLQQNPQ
jgi:hypothetical protein